MNLPNKCWVIVADAEKALFLINHGDEDIMDLRVMEKHTHSAPPDRKLAADKPGRLWEKATGVKSAVQNADFQRLEKEEFARDLTDMLRSHALNNDFDDLVLVLPQRFLGEVRQLMDKNIKEKIRAEVGRDLTQFDIKEIEEHIKGYEQ